MANEVATIDQYKPLPAAQIQQQAQTIDTVLKQVMKKEVHYGVIPGTKKPTLLKPGAEKIMATFRLSPEIIVEDLSKPDLYRYRVIVNIKSPTGQQVGSGVGECGSDEEKYKWKRCYIDQEFDATDIDRRKIKFVKGKGGYVDEQKMIRTEPADQANTVLKMAKKRAMIDAVLTATAASDLFDQDLDEQPQAYESTVDFTPSQSKSQQQENGLIKKLESIAKHQGSDALIKEWQSLTDQERGSVGPQFGRIKTLCKE